MFVFISPKVLKLSVPNLVSGLCVSPERRPIDWGAIAESKDIGKVRLVFRLGSPKVLKLAVPNLL